MNIKRPYHLFLSLVSVAVFLSILHFHCAAPDVAGSSTETGNVEAIAVTATIYDGSGLPAEGATVYVRKQSFVKDIKDFGKTPIPDAVVDSNGIFIIDSLDTGDYSIEIRDASSQAVLLTCSLDEGDTIITMNPDTTRATATLTGTVTHSLPERENLYVQVYGLDRLVKVDSITMQYTIPDVPEGDFTVNIVTTNKIYKPTTITDVAAQPDSTTTIDTVPVLSMTDEYYVYWQYNRQCIINTAPTGADITDDVYHFPLLIRLNDANFSFGEAQLDGRDIRFTKTDGTPLYYQIERWDRQNSVAEIWVLIDTVFGANSTQSITMYWGNDQAQSRSNSTKVFETENNFAAAWHLGNNVLDATANKNDGINSNSVNIAGIIGDGRYFDGSGDYIRFGNDASIKEISAEITTGCWIKTSLHPDTNVSIIRHDGHYTGLQTSFGSMDAWVVVWTPDRRITAFTWDSVFNDNNWHYYVSTYDMNRGVTVYLDGKVIHTDTTITGALATDATEDFFIGGSELGHEFYEGLLDEVRVSSHARSAAWIKLCYENQKADAKMVIFQ